MGPGRHQPPANRIKNNEKEAIGMDATPEWFVEPEGDRVFTIDGTDYNVTWEEFNRAARELTRITQTGHGHLTLETVDKTVHDLWFIHGTVVTA